MIRIRQRLSLFQTNVTNTDTTVRNSNRPNLNNARWSRTRRRHNNRIINAQWRRKRRRHNVVTILIRIMKLAIEQQ